MPRTTVAVIIVNWNSEGHLDRCLRALANQTVHPTKIIVLDNGSKIFRLPYWRRQYPEVLFYCLETNVGFAAASNKGAAFAKDCDWIAFLNPDAFPESNWIETLLKAAVSHTEFNFFASYMLSATSPEVIDGTGDFYHSSGAAWRRAHQHRMSDCFFKNEEVFGACAAAALVSRQAFEKVGGFDESFFCYFEDVDLSFRLRLSGGRCLFIPDAKVRHVCNGSTSRSSDFAVYYGHRNIILTYFKNMPLPLLWYYLPQHLLINLFSILWCARRGQGRLVIKAKFDALKSFPSILNKRKLIHNKRILKSNDVKKSLQRGLFKHPHLVNASGIIKRLKNR